MTKVREVGPFERIITLKIDEAALDEAKKSAARRLASEVKIKGFRPGKAPLKVVESAVGFASLRREAIDDALPAVVADAIGETDLAPAVNPRLEEIRDEESGVEVDVLITLWPSLKKVPKYKGRKVEIHAPDVDEAAVDDQIERMREQFADLEDVDREAFDGDFVIVDVNTSREGEEYAAGSATDMLFEVGSGMFLEGMDDAIRGKGAGHIAQFTTHLPASLGEDGGAEVDVRLLIKQVKAKRLPELTDEWVDDMTEFESVAEMRSELFEQLTRMRVSGLRAEFERVLLKEMLEGMDLELPSALLDAEMDAVLHRFAHRLETQGIEFEQYLALTGQDQQVFFADLKAQAELNLRTRVLLESVVEAEGLELDEGEFDETVAGLAAASGMEQEEYRAALVEGGREQTLTGDILRRKAVDRLLELAVPVDAHGTEIELPEPDPGSAGEAEAAEGDESPEGTGEPKENNRDHSPDDGVEPAEVDA